MHIFIQFTAKDLMSDLVTEHYRSLPVLSRFGISLGFGDKTIEEVCVENKVDTETFLAIVNLLLDEEQEFDPKKLSIDSLLFYLHNSHDYFLNYRFPGIRTKLWQVLEPEHGNLNEAVMKYFDEYATEVRKHMDYEEKVVFPYVKSLLQGEKKQKYSISMFSDQHEKVEARLSEFKRILIKYYPAKSSNEINSVLFDIFNSEYDLASHITIEDKLFVPAVIALEHKNNQKP